jgi:hypothetical protein
MHALTAPQPLNFFYNPSVAPLRFASEKKLKEEAIGWREVR